MKIKIVGEWHRQESFAIDDRKYLKFLFKAKFNDGIESIALSDWREYRATLNGIDTDEYDIEKKK